MVARRDVDGVPTVHALWHGFPLCRFSLSVPASWPDNHFWISAADADPSEVTCRRCREEMEAWKTTTNR